MRWYHFFAECLCASSAKVVEVFGADVWSAILRRAEVEEDVILSLGRIPKLFVWSSREHGLAAADPGKKWTLPAVCCAPVSTFLTSARCATQRAHIPHVIACE